MKLSSSGDAYFSLTQKEDKPSEQPQTSMTKILEEPSKNEIKLESDLNNSIDSPIISKKSAPSTPARMSKQFEKFNIEECKFKSFVFFTQ